MKQSLWQQHFPQLLERGDAAIAALIEASSLVSLPAEVTVFRRGASCANYLLVVSGRVRVALLAENGREVTLYHVLPGSSCVLTTACLLGASHYPAEGVTETPVEALLIPSAAFNQGLHGSAAFRDFVFDNLGRRFAEVLARMEDLHFGDIDKRLARCLLALPRTDGGLNITHQQLATELGTAREVVSRHLKYFEERGWVRLSRNRIEIRDAGALGRL